MDGIGPTFRCTHGGSLADFGSLNNLLKLMENPSTYSIGMEPAFCSFKEIAQAKLVARRARDGNDPGRPTGTAGHQEVTRMADAISAVRPRGRPWNVVIAGPESSPDVSKAETLNSL